MKRIGVVFAMEREARATLSDPLFGWRECGTDLWESSSFPARLVLSGIGKVFASWALSRLAGTSDLIVSLGTSGGLTVDAGGTYLVREFVEYDMDATGLGFPRGQTPYSPMTQPVIAAIRPETFEIARRAALAAASGAKVVRAASGDRFMSDPMAAALVSKETGAEIVDMESAAIAKLCMLKAHNASGEPMECFAFRAVSDKADQDASRSFESLVDAQGIVFSRFLGELCRLLS
jgi:nucleoside phosphorylase